MIKRGDYKVDWHDEQFIRELVATSVSQSDVLRKLNLVPASNAVTLRKYIKRYNIDISHFTPYTARTVNGTSKLSLDEILVENSTRVDRYGLKKRLVQEGILSYECDLCGNEGLWNGKPLTLQLEHRNGINNDHRRENLCFLCPNCHTQTSTFAGRNKQGKKNK